MYLLGIRRVTAWPSSCDKDDLDSSETMNFLLEFKRTYFGLYLPCYSGEHVTPFGSGQQVHTEGE